MGREAAVGWLARLVRVVDLDDQVEACRRVFASDTRWTVVRGSDLEEGESQGLPVWSRHVGDPILESNITRRVDFALFMVEALENDELHPRGPGDCRLPDALGARARCKVIVEGLQQRVGSLRLSKIRQLIPGTSRSNQQPAVQRIHEYRLLIDDER